MNCPRCQGLIIRDYEYAGGEWYKTRRIFRCINCGYRHDGTYDSNRKKNLTGEIVQ